MKNQKSLLIHFLIFLVVLGNGMFAYPQTNANTGLHFSSHEEIKDQRTSLNLTPERPFNFPKGFSMEFDAMFRPGDGHFGYIYRIVGDNKVNIDLISNFWSPENTFSLVLKDTALFTFRWEDIPDGQFGSWIKIQFRIDEGSRISISLNGNTKTEKITGIPALEKYNIEFGACKLSSFLSTDVSPMTVKNIRIYDSGGQIHRNWELAKHRDTCVYDELTKAKAVVLNPKWEINRHLEWKKERSFQLEHLLGVAKDEKNGRVFLVDNSAVYVCKMEKFTIDTMETISIDTLLFLKGKPFPCDGNQITYNPLTDELWSYNFTGDEISRFNFNTQTWSIAEPECKQPDLWHHSSYLSTTDTTLITFGGYGFYTYKSFFNRYSQHSQKWEKLNLGNHVPPRYLSAMGPMGNNKLLIFGGYGSVSGRQEISPNFYYTLYSIDEMGTQPKLLWKLDSVETPFVPAHSLVTDSLTNSFYTLLYNPVNFQTSLRLAHFGTDEPNKTLYADSIPYKFLDTESWSTLFLNKKDSKLIAITSFENEVELYSLAYPPLLAKDVFQEEMVAYSKLKTWPGLTLIGSAILIVVLLLFKKWPKHRNVAENSTTEAKEKVDTPLSGYTASRVVVSSVYLLGGFQAFDQEGHDVTASFTPTLKQLFLLIFLSSVKDGKGISSSKLDEILWFDKTEESARNNRNVNISKLRVLFKNIGHLDLEYNGTSWKVTFGEAFYSDYTKAWQLIKKSRSSAGLREEEILELIQVVSSGELCPNIQTEWMDKFKVDFANELIQTLTVLSNHIDEHTPHQQELLLAISDCILRFDSLNEDAIATKCSTLFQMGKKNSAKQAYDLFCREYKHLLGLDFTRPFSDLVKQ